VLTVVDRVPPEDAFRPPYIKGPKPIYRVSQIKWDRLPALEAPEGFKPPTRNPMERLWMDHSGSRGNANGTIHPRKNMDPYYFFMNISQVSAALLVEFPKRKELLYSFMQYGIDCYFISLQNGEAWRAYGGFGNGRKWPILFTGILLDDEKMMDPAKKAETSMSKNGKWTHKFGEDGHTYYGKPTREYPEGKPLWGQDLPAKWFKNHDIRDPDGVLEPTQLPKDKPLGGGYRFTCSRGWSGPAVAARLMGATDLWDHTPFFDYVDRWIKEGAPKQEKSYYSYGPDPIKAMWLKYRPQADEIGKKYEALRNEAKIAP